ncbi:MAG TPA: hypothetical protein VK063_02280 [Beutenbergiaceae bacterium]|nr:hypothetical protein [Beutenbergiaceae bacterium]
MAEVQVDAEQVRTAATEADHAAQIVAACHLGDDLTELSAAIPGGRSAEVAVALADAWVQAARRWEDAVADYSQALTDSARDYGMTDDASAGLHHRLARDLPAPLLQ